MERTQEKRGRVSHSTFTQRQHLSAENKNTVFSLVESLHHSSACSRFTTNATLTFVLRDFVTLQLAQTSVNGNRHPLLRGDR